jgi:hypothetical protein
MQARLSARVRAFVAARTAVITRMRASMESRTAFASWRSCEPTAWRRRRQSEKRTTQSRASICESAPPRRGPHRRARAPENAAARGETLQTWQLERAPQWPHRGSFRRCIRLQCAHVGEVSDLRCPAGVTVRLRRCTAVSKSGLVAPCSRRTRSSRSREMRSTSLWHTKAVAAALSRRRRARCRSATYADTRAVSACAERVCSAAMASLLPQQSLFGLPLQARAR